MEAKFSNFTIDHILAHSGETPQHPWPTENYTNGGSSSAGRSNLYHSAQPARLNGFHTYGMPIALPVYQVAPPAFSFCSDCCYSRPAPPNFSNFSPGHPDQYAYETGKTYNI